MKKTSHDKDHGSVQNRRTPDIKPCHEPGAEIYISNSSGRSIDFMTQASSSNGRAPDSKSG